LNRKYSKGYQIIFIKRLRDNLKEGYESIQCKCFILIDYLVTPMLRRDIFNLIFNKNPDTGAAADLTDPIVAKPAYIATGTDVIYSKTWSGPFVPKSLLPEWSASHAFKLTLDTKENTAAFQVGGVKIGIYVGCLFIGEVSGPRAVFETGNGIQLVMSVTPQPNGRSFAKLMLVDEYGLTRSILKSAQQLNSDWPGTLMLHSIFIKLAVQGILSIKLTPNHHTTV